jgi:tRNA G18 (ribose-2'-O)-methylase SpoU
MRIVRISDIDDESLNDYRALTDVALRKRSEPADGLYIAESSKVIARALIAGHQPRSVLLLEKWLPDIQILLENVDVPVYVGDSDLLKQITGFDLHRGAIASMQRPALRPVDEILTGARLVVVLEDIVDHTNVGAIFRSAAGLGADAVLVSPRCADPLYRRSVRVSMGTVLQVPWTRLPDWPDGANALRSAGFHLAALALGSGTTLDEFADDPPAKVAIMLGAEGDGLSRAAIDLADTIVTIPMFNGVDSLNVASASAVALYSLTRRARSRSKR